MLTAEQRVTLKADILANSDALAFYSIGDLTGLAALYNESTSPLYVVWKTSVTTVEMHAAYVWAELDNLTQTKFNQLNLLLSTGEINPSAANVRQGLNDIFTGPQLLNTRTALVTLSKRQATRIEKLFAVGDGTVASPSTMAVEGPIGYPEFIGL